jgi:CheY-like chemotaxis protein
MKVLVVDDEPSMTRLFEQRFHREIREGRVEFIFAYSGEEALELWTAGQSDLVMILSDINMPGMNGLELLRRLKELRSEVPIFTISAYENVRYQEQSLELGADGFLPKPLDFELIRALVLKNQEGREP